MTKFGCSNGILFEPALPHNYDNVVEKLMELLDCVNVAGDVTVPEIPDRSVISVHPLVLAQAVLANSLKSQQHLETKVEKIRSRLLVAGEQVPTIDQHPLSMLQEAYVNAATAYTVASDKTVIWQQRVLALLSEQGGRHKTTKNEQM